MEVRFLDAFYIFTVVRFKRRCIGWLGLFAKLVNGLVGTHTRSLCKAHAEVTDAAALRVVCRFCAVNCRRNNLLVGFADQQQDYQPCLVELPRVALVNAV